MQLTLPAGRHEFRLLEGLELVGAAGNGRPLEVLQQAPERYSLVVPEEGTEVELSWSGSIPSGDPMRGRLFLQATGGFLPAESGWYPAFDEIAMFGLRISVRVPAGHRVVASGSLIGDPEETQTHYHAVYEHPRADGIALATGAWQERSLEADGVRVRTLFPAELDASHAQSYLEHTAGYLQMFADRAGPYPYGSFTVAASPMPVGFAFPGFTLLGERVIPLPFIPRTSLAHELMHSWWGTGVYIDYGSGNWAEGLTTFMADYFLDEQRGEGQETRYRWLLDLAALPTQEHPLGDFRGGNQGANRIVGYNRGALMFQMLREKIGPEAFDQGTRLLRDRHLFEVAGWADLERAFSDAAGTDLAEFFQAWVRRPGLPELALHSVTQQPNGSGWIVEGTLQQIQPEQPWPLRVPVQLETAAGSDRRMVPLDERSVVFRIELDAPASALAVDPHHELLRRLSDPPPILRTVTLHPDTRLIATQEGLEPFARGLLGRMPERAEAFAADVPLLVMGSTEDVERWLQQAGAPEPPESLVRRGHGRMWTLPGTRTAVISANDGDGLANLVGMLRHHGHRSYLVQNSDGSTVANGVWSAQSDPLRVEAIPAPKGS